MGLKILKYKYTIVCVCVCIYINMGTFIKINQKNYCIKTWVHSSKSQKKKKKDIRLNNISKFLRLNLTWIHSQIKEKRMYPYKFKNGLEKN